eukprot:s3184_g2.t1
MQCGRCRAAFADKGWIEPAIRFAGNPESRVLHYVSRKQLLQTCAHLNGPLLKMRNVTTVGVQLDISIRCAGMAVSFEKVNLRALVLVWTGPGLSAKVYKVYFIWFAVL